MPAILASNPAAPADPARTRMFAEASEGGASVRRFLDHNRDTLAGLARQLRAHPPHSVTTCARGSSDHAATFGKYLIETRLGVPTSSAALSTSSLYAAPVVADRSLCLAISQSGRSPDLLTAVEAHKRAGAHVVALVNDETSPLAALADTLLPLKAGPETSVAATKSYITSLAALAAIVAGDDGSAAALGREAIRSALHGYDGMAPETEFTRAVIAHFGQPADIVHWVTTATPRDFGALAPLTMRFAQAGDAVAVELVQQSATDLGRYIMRLHELGCEKVCLVGGMAEPFSPWLSPWTKAVLAEPEHDALEGAILLAHGHDNGFNGGFHTGFPAERARAS